MKKMNIKQEILVLEKLKQKIVQDLNCGDPMDWTHAKYECLVENIYEKTKVKLGISTLKRFFGKIQSKSLPGKTTKETLAQFAGYDSYMGFFNEQIERDGNRKKLNWKFIFWIGLIVVFLILSFLFFPYLKKIIVKRNISGTLMIKDTIGTVPFTQTFYYKTTGIKNDSLQIRERGKDPVSVAASDSVQNYIHFVPGRRQVDLLYDDEILSTVSYNVVTPGWLFIYPFADISPRHYIPLDTVRKGFLQISKQELDRAKITISEMEPMLSYFNFRDYDVDGNEFTFTARIKNPRSVKEKLCQDAVIMIHTDTSGYFLQLTQNGCELYNKFFFGEKKWDGSNTELGHLSVNLDEWQDVKIVAGQGKCHLYLNAKEVLSDTFDMQLGNVTGIVFQFRGCGMVDEVALLNPEGREVYQAGF